MPAAYDPIIASALDLPPARIVDGHAVVNLIPRGTPDKGAALMWMPQSSAARLAVACRSHRDNGPGAVERRHRPRLAALPTRDRQRALELAGVEVTSQPGAPAHSSRWARRRFSSAGSSGANMRMARRGSMPVSLAGELPIAKLDQTTGGLK